MSKHPTVPSPAPKVFPSIIRAAGTRVALLATGFAAFLLLAGGGYLVVKSKEAPKQTTTQSDSKVLSSNTQKNTDSQAKPTTQSAPAPATTQTTVPDPAKDTNDTKSVAASFDIKVDPSQIHQAGLLIYVPFSVKRQGNLPAPIVPGNISVTSGGLLANVTIQSEVMTGTDTGQLVLLPVKLGSNELNVHFSASSGNVNSSTSFTYKLRR